jgi:hypothetical protein
MIQPSGITLKKQFGMETSILSAVAYFDIFHYPLRPEEVRKFTCSRVSVEDIGEILKTVVAKGLIYDLGGFYSLQNDFSLVEKRKKGNEKAEAFMSKATQIAVFLQGFPFVRAVSVSGSLSKNFAHEQADIDFFIITKSDRLWIARTFLHIFKKLTYIFGKQHLYCMNYFIDEDALMIEERDIYTATELITLLPLAGEDEMNKFFLENQWAEANFPNYGREQNFSEAKKRPGFFKIAMEWMLSGNAGDRLDNILGQWTTRRWIAKENAGRRNVKGNPMSLQTGKHFCRSNPGNFLEKVLASHSEKMRILRSRSLRYFKE